MSDNLMKAQDTFLSGVNRICNKFGLNNVMARLYALLYLNGKALSLNDMVERLKVSKGSVSTNIRALERYGVVREVWMKGSRRDYYEAEADIAKVMMDRVKAMSRSRLSEVDEMIESSQRALKSVNPSGKEEKEAVELFRQKINKLKNLQDKAQSVFNLFNSGLVSNMLIGKSKKK